MRPTPYRIHIPDTQLDDLKRRLACARWPHAIAAAGWERGVPLDYAKSLIDYWVNEFDWRTQEAWLNRYPQYTAEIDGQTIHYFHVTSKQPGALPLMLLHGWPSSSVEFVPLIDALTDPASHDGSAGDAFDVIIPTTPGFGLSAPLTEHWDAARTARAYSALMRELGYRSWGVHGGDVGSDIAGEINHIDESLVGVHVSTDMPSIVWYAGFTGTDPRANPLLSDAQREEVRCITQRGSEDGGYLEIQRTRPLTIGYLLNDSPVGQLAWIAEKFKAWSGTGEKLLEDAVDLDQLLTNVSLYWFTMSGAAAADFLCTNLHAQRDWGRASHAPMGMAVFGAASCARVLQDPEKQMAHWSEFDVGGHFPAMEVPSLLIGDLRAFFRGRY